MEVVTGPFLKINEKAISDKRSSLLVAVEDVSVTWGRDSVFSAVEPAMLKASILVHNARGVGLQEVERFLAEPGPVGRTVELSYKWAAAPGRPSLPFDIFKGKIVEARLIADPARGADYRINIIATDPTRELGNNLVGDTRTRIGAESSSGINITLHQMTRAFQNQERRQFERVTLADEYKNGQLKDTEVYLGKIENKSWFDYLAEVYSSVANQSFYYDPRTRSITSTVVPRANGKTVDEGLSGILTFKPYSGYTATKIDPSEVYGDHHATFNLRKIGTVEESAYTSTWQPHKATHTVINAARQFELASLRWNNRAIRGKNRSLDNANRIAVTNYLYQLGGAPAPPTLTYRPGTDMKNSGYWLSINHERNADLSDIWITKLLLKMNKIKIPWARPINGEIRYNGRTGWTIKQNLAWCMLGSATGV
ncbi:hypothetical protein [Corynebacterium propinquum]|uniref:hypothetical protein n=1 Tax=Corynebacterium propinquum TaxID=43769 RepID=UPI0011C8374E|nr:hypothetical protein [Corynebacterium propinquum]